MKRGTLKVYLGMAPGVGKTYAMLDEAQRRHNRGLDVVVGLVETHGRPQTAAHLDGLEVVPRRSIAYRDTVFEEMDTDAVIARRPQLALVDELAHTNIPGSKNEKRWQDIDDILAAGIDVVSTVNIQHLESLNDVVAQITGTTQRETVPDEVVRRADQLEIVDISPEALRRRMAHGNIYPAERIDAALANYFRPGNLTALREIALLWMAERVDEVLQKYRDAHGITDRWEARERIVAALTGGPEGGQLLRRAARIAASSVGSELLAVHIVRSDGLQGDDPAALAEQRRLTESCGGSWHQIVADDVASALVDFAHAQNATQLVLGVTHRSPVSAFLDGESIEAKVTRLAEHIDVHLVTHDNARRRPRRLALPAEAFNSPLSATRRWQGLAVAVVVLPLLTWILTGLTHELNLASDILLFLLVVIAVAVIGGLWPALFAAVAAGALLTYFLTPPRYTFIVGSFENAIAIVVFVVLAILVAMLMEQVVRRTRQAARASAEAATLSGLAGAILRGETSLDAILERARETFGLAGLALRERAAPDAEFEVVAQAGEPAADDDRTIPVGDLRQLVVTGTGPSNDTERVFAAFAAQAVVARERELLASQAARVDQMAELDRVRTALLSAVSHDLRSPLTSAIASVTSLRSRETEWTPAEREELLAIAGESLARLAILIENLLDMSRLQAGAFPVRLAPVALDATVATVLDNLEPLTVTPTVDLTPGIEVMVDAALLERVLANLITNAVRHTPAGALLTLTASRLGDRVEVRVIDHGPGIRPEDRSQAFRPFHRLGDRDNTTGIGLGLALSLGLTEAMNGTLTMEETPGGGLTMVLSLPGANPDRTPPSGPATQARQLGSQEQRQQRYDETDAACSQEDPADRQQEHPPL